MKIAVDVDGVILDSMVQFCQICNKRFGMHHVKDDATNWDFYQDWKIPLGVLTETFRMLHENPMDTPIVDKNTPKIMEELQVTHQLDIITSREIHTRDPLINRLDSLGIHKGSHYGDIILSPTMPSDVKLTYNYDIFIDDNPNLATSIHEYENKILLLFDQPWNRSVQDSSIVVRVKSWKAILEYINSIL